MIKVIPHSEYLKNLPDSIVVAVPYTEGTKPRFPDNLIEKCHYCGHLVEIHPYNAKAKAYACLKCATTHVLSRRKPASKKTSRKTNRR
jgi:hypothetical protein